MKIHINMDIDMNRTIGYVIFEGLTSGSGRVIGCSQELQPLVEGRYILGTVFYLHELGWELVAIDPLHPGQVMYWFRYKPA